MTGEDLISVEQALQQVVSSAAPIASSETLPLQQCRGRFLADDILATITQPPFRASAMDGYALRSGELRQLPQSFAIIGESAAGRRFEGRIGSHEAVKIFTGAPVPDDADCIVMQEDTNASHSEVTILSFNPQKNHIRDSGLDFVSGKTLLRKGQKLGSRQIGLAAAAGHGYLPVIRKPKVALLATGDELALPGAHHHADQIFSSNSYSIRALLEEAGAEVIDIGIAKDNLEILERSIRQGCELQADILVTMGGISAGERDFVQKVFAKQGMSLGFWKVAIRPGKPLLFGTLGNMLLFGLPGNPVSAYITGMLFVLPAIRKMLGVNNAAEIPMESCLLGEDLAANGERQDHIRATLHNDESGFVIATPMASQDSSLISVLAEADALIIRKPHAPFAKKGSFCKIMRL